jgi:hypothetical protein
MRTQRRLCERFAAPVIGTIMCQDIKVADMQAIVNAAPTAGEGARVQGMISALVSAGIEAEFLANPRLAKVHWHAGNRPQVSCQGQQPVRGPREQQWVDPAEICRRGCRITQEVGVG